jgi:hypothetical protein
VTGNRWTLSQAAAALLSLIALGQASPGHALPGKCLLRVDGQTYLDSICNVDVTVTDGSFSIGTGESTRAKHFAVVNVGPIKGRAIGYWNGVAGEDHAHESLGVLIRQGACWSNARAKICAVRN